VVFNEVLINAMIKENAFLLNTEMLLNEGGSFKGHFMIPSFFPIRDPLTKPMQGNLNLVLKKLDFIPVFFPEIRDSRGFLNAQIFFAGDLSAPVIEGKLSLVDGEVTLPRLGVTWKGIRVLAESQGVNHFTLSGQLKSGEGQISLKGEAHYPVFGERFFRLNLMGDRFEAIKIPEAWMVVSPDLKVQFKGEEIRIEGELGIPEANIEPKDLSGSVQISPDVVILGEEEKDQTQRKIYSKVRFNLGDQVQFNGLGLKTRLKGGLMVQEEPEKLTSGSGEIQILEGKYKAYGQELEIERGRLIFADSPLDNPGLDIQAVRKISDVTAGVNIGGRLKDPQLTLFSNPSMEQADIFSYLLLGRPIRQASASEGKELQNAATSAGIAGGGFLAKKLDPYSVWNRSK